MHPSRKVYQNRRPSDRPVEVMKRHKSSFSQAADFGFLPQSIRALLEAQAKLHKQIHEIENRLRFGYSDALYDYKITLVKEDVLLAIQINQSLLALV